ncbi:hypothetical protein VNO78_30715 [Psophocarpus tetragonolobus]|uniref:Uncharacterized protein n=1 Tax=Psophocarpus tetragonolobus TaxID=3891 RepID=A0AAN9RXV3_PSOTE
MLVVRRVVQGHADLEDGNDQQQTAIIGFQIDRQHEGVSFMKLGCRRRKSWLHLHLANENSVADHAFINFAFINGGHLQSAMINFRSLRQALILRVHQFKSRSLGVTFISIGV